jgi:hypothetical protein
MLQTRRTLETLTNRYFDSYMEEVLAAFPGMTRTKFFEQGRHPRAVRCRYVLAALLYHVVLEGRHQDVAGIFCGIWPTSMNRALNHVDRALRSKRRDHELKKDLLRVCRQIRLPPERLLLEKREK